MILERPWGSKAVSDTPLSSLPITGGIATVSAVRAFAYRLSGCAHAGSLDGAILVRHERPGALLVDELLSQDVCVPAVLGQLAQHVEIHPAQRERAAPVAVEQVIEP